MSTEAVQELWTQGRARGGHLGDRKEPSAGLVAVLVALHSGGPSYGRDIARRAGQSLPNVTSLWLPKLARFGFVVCVGTEPGMGHQGGGRPARYWDLTYSGRQLAELLAIRCD
jgi:hypothetical protein